MFNVDYSKISKIKIKGAKKKNEKKKLLLTQPKGKKYLAVLYLDTKTDVIEPILRDEDEAKQLNGMIVFVKDEKRIVQYRLLEELVESYWK